MSEPTKISDIMLANLLDRINQEVAAGANEFGQLTEVTGATMAALVPQEIRHDGLRPVIAWLEQRVGTATKASA